MMTITISGDAWAAVTAALGVLILILNYLHERGPAKTVNERLDSAESRLDTIEDWKNS